MDWQMTDADFKRYVLGGLFVLLVFNFNSCAERARIANQIEATEKLCRKSIGEKVVP